jgi:sec-independent protein translocase protein TatA
MFGSFGIPELLIILVIVLLIFGPKKLPQLGKAIGRTITGFRKGMRESEDEDGTTSEERQIPKSSP